MIRREPGELASDIGRTHCENWSGSRRLLYAPCTEELAYVQLTSLKGDETANQVPIDRAVWRSVFPIWGWIIDRLPDDGRGDCSSSSAPGIALAASRWSAMPQRTAAFLGQGGCAMWPGTPWQESIMPAT
jgi:hypothetical protein